jgi:hypothetical protein
MKSFDKSLATAIKAAAKMDLKAGPLQAVPAELREIRQQVFGTDLFKPVECLIAFVSSPATEKCASKTVELLRDLIAIGYKSAAAELFQYRISDLETLPLCEVLSIAPNTTCLEKWSKSAKKSAREVECELLADPFRAYQTAGADWLLAHAAPEKLRPIHALLLSREPRPKFSPQWQEVLLASLKKDKKGEILEALISAAANNPEASKTLIEFIWGNRSVFKTLPDILALILTRKNPSLVAGAFVQEFFAPVFARDDSENERASAILARLGTAILLAERRTPEADAVLEFIRKSAQRLRSITKGIANQSRTWVLDNLAVEERQPDGKLCINLQGARHIALAFEKVDQGFPPKEILSVTARHLGLTPIGRRNEIVPYEPLKHDDVEGGLVPGDSVLIVDPGLSFNNESVLRAKVKKTKGDSHV